MTKNYEIKSYKKAIKRQPVQLKIGTETPKLLTIFFNCKVDELLQAQVSDSGD